jgi:HTH-type transcriptional regulator/antitoxin MqsA
MVWEKRPTELRYADHTSMVRLLGWWCSNCGEGILDGKQLGVKERAFKTLQAKVDGVLSPDEVTRARKVLGLSQREASERLGGGPRSFQKYESGTAAVTISMSHLLRLLEKDPKRLRELEPRQPPKRRAHGRR